LLGNLALPGVFAKKNQSTKLGIFKLSRGSAGLLNQKQGYMS